MDLTRLIDPSLGSIISPFLGPPLLGFESACKAAVVHCKSKGKKITKLALQYSLVNKEISSVLIGMSSVSQVFKFRVPS
ncbi:predicted protein [Arabidopsis lyrata subsp. lyrata]|uniref:Predicted protein n=1 Tax=Arabidopsis lyrata subsp. lyrata TaxID=81972 RepID=D7KC50_ARALL|nr:predicted protein [Arabidopsis lyrata subsp. lyrata]